MASAKTQNAQRRHMAQIAARLMHEQGIRDFHAAKRKAAQHLGIDVRDSVLPRNQEIESALAEHQRLFDHEGRAQRLIAMREAALEAMLRLAEFKPRLVGEVLSGVVRPNSDIQLHVFAEQSETFDLFLQSRDIPYDIVERRLRVERERYRFYPAFRLTVGGFGFEMTLFPERAIRQPPLSRIDGAPIERASRARVERLLAEARLESDEWAQTRSVLG